MSVRQRLSGGTTQTDGQARNFVKAALTDVLRSGRGQTGPIVLAGDKERRKIWPDPVGRRNRTARPGWPVWSVSAFAHAVGHALNADCTECRPPKIKAACGRNADVSHTANHHLAV